MTIRWRVLASKFREAWPTWLLLGGLASALAIGWAFSKTLSDAIRYAGMLLQLLGLITVAIGLSQMRRLFGRPSFGTKVYAWFRGLASAFRRPRPITLEGVGAIGSAQAFGDLRVSRGTRPDAPLEERVSTLEQNLRLFQEELDARVQQLRRELTGTKESIDRERRERVADNQRTNQKIDEVAVGGLYLEIVGLFWLILGVTGATIPGEIAACLLSVRRPAA